MTFDEYWRKLNSKKTIDGDVKLSPQQFEKMLRQAYDIGHSEGADQVRKARKMADEYSGKTPSADPSEYADLFGGPESTDFLKGLFSHLKK
jgi:3-mercaptopyruvate sulfurtransferase SseA